MARHHRTHWDGQCVGNLLVRHLLHLAKQQDLPKIDWQVIDRFLNHLGVRALNQDRFRRGGINRDFRSVLLQVNRFRRRRF